MPKSLKLTLLACSVALVLSVFLGLNAHGVHAAGTAAQDGAYRQMNVYDEVLQHIQSDYVVVPSIPTVTNGALRGLLESLDADSSYMSPEEYKEFQADKGGKAQVGVNVSKRYGYATVISVVPNSPADKANFTDGDIIEAVAGQDTRNLSLAMIRLMLEGAPGSEVEIAVIRPGRADPDKVQLDRVLVSEPPVAETMYENSSILYLKPEEIDHEHVQDVESRLKAMGKNGNKKVLLDLRDVATGDVPDAIQMANFFLKSGTIATLRGQTVPTQTFTADESKAINTTAPLIVLVNRGTAGPAELVAAAIRDDKRGELVGERTFGEGAEQKTFNLPDGGAIILSVAKYAAPDGKFFEDDAVTPGTVVASSQNFDFDTDKKALKKPSVEVDDQLTKALDMLKAKAA